MINILSEHYKLCQKKEKKQLIYEYVSPSDLDAYTRERDLFYIIDDIHMVPRLVIMTKYRIYFVTNIYDDVRRHYVQTSFLYTMGNFSRARTITNDDEILPRDEIDRLLKMLDDRIESEDGFVTEEDVEEMYQDHIKYLSIMKDDINSEDVDNYDSNVSSTDLQCTQTCIVDDTSQVYDQSTTQVYNCSSDVSSIDRTQINNKYIETDNNHEQDCNTDILQSSNQFIYVIFLILIFINVLLSYTDYLCNYRTDTKLIYDDVTYQYYLTQ
jgi:hypothetical protein